MLRILVSGANGQLGHTLKDFLEPEPSFELLFADRALMDLSQPEAITKCFDAFQPDVFINAAAYTQVDKAEEEETLAMQINGHSLETIAKCCATHHTVLFQISSDYVYHGPQNKAYQESDPVFPQNVYARSKYLGEQLAQQYCPATYIIRTSWLYAPLYGSNFVKTMLRLSKERKTLWVVQDQIGTPTCTFELAEVILLMIQKIQLQTPIPFGIYNFSAEGVASWYDFAKAIFELAGIEMIVHPTTTERFPRPAARPPFSLMDKSKIKKALGLPIYHWRESLQQVMKYFL